MRSVPQVTEIAAVEHVMGMYPDVGSSRRFPFLGRQTMTGLWQGKPQRAGRAMSQLLGHRRATMDRL
jgi:hypothetical protein